MRLEGCKIKSGPRSDEMEVFKKLGTPSELLVYIPLNTFKRAL